MGFDTLFERWKNEYRINAFIRDGIVDSAHYSNPHVLFVLRDMNCQTERDLCADLRRDGSGWKTWNNIGRWSKALLDGCEEYPKDMSKEKRVEQLRRIAVMNLKKEGGGSRTNGKQVPVISFCHPQVTNLEGNRGHEKLFAPLYQEMVFIRKMFIKHLQRS